MFQLDDKFLQDIGLGGMPEDQKKPFLQHIYSELELRVGTKLSEGMGDEQLQEFESIVDRKAEVVNPWLEKNAPDYQNEETYKRIQTAMKVEADDPRVKFEYAATKWLEINRPDYRDVVAGVLGELKEEISKNKDKILGQQQPDQPIT